MNYAYLLLWPFAGAVALSIVFYQLHKYGTNMDELVEYLAKQKSNQAPKGKVKLILCAAVVLLGPASLVPIVMDAIKRKKS